MSKRPHSVSYWFDEEWPLDGPGALFLGRALRQIAPDVVEGGSFRRHPKAKALASRLAAGQIPSFVQTPQMMRLNPEIWVTTPDVWDSRFHACAIDLAALNGGSVPLSLPDSIRQLMVEWLWIGHAEFQASFSVVPLQATALAEAKARAELSALARAHAAGQGDVPIKAKWIPAAQEADAKLSGEAAKRAWRAVAEEFPALSSLAGKPRPRQRS